jgi:hypothetical protein
MVPSTSSSSSSSSSSSYPSFLYTSAPIDRLIFERAELAVSKPLISWKNEIIAKDLISSTERRVDLVISHSQWLQTRVFVSSLLILEQSVHLQWDDYT